MECGAGGMLVLLLLGPGIATARLDITYPVVVQAGSNKTFGRSLGLGSGPATLYSGDPLGGQHGQGALFSCRLDLLAGTGTCTAIRLGDEEPGEKREGQLLGISLGRKYTSVKAQNHIGVIYCHLLSFSV